MTLRSLASGLLFFVALVGRGAATPVDRPPNIILIVADDLGWADLGCYGSRYHKTPNLDRLAGQGRRFTQAYAASPVCSPSRAALLTGKHPARLNLTDWLPGRPDRPDQRLCRPAIRQELPFEEETIAEALAAHGYATALIGKWHLGGDNFGPDRQGFATNIGGSEIGTTLSYFSPFQRGNRSMIGLEQAPPGEYLTDRLTTEAERFIDSHQKKPFFLYLPHYAVHTPMTAPPGLVAKYAPWDGIPHGRQENPTYAAMIESLDASVGRIMAKLDGLGLSDETIVIFTSDNGGLATTEGPITPPTINAPLREGKGWLYEGGLRVPLIIRWPGRIRPGEDSTPVWGADLFPTLAEVGGAGRRDGVDGTSLLKLLLGGESPSPRTLYWHYPHYSNQSSRPGGAIRDGRYKLVEDFETGRIELFDLENDPRESTNLAMKDGTKAKELAGKLADWRKSIGAKLPTANPNFHPNPQDDRGVVTIPASTAHVHGSMLRFEPLPHKNTLGYWINPEDWASFEFETNRPSDFQVEALVGCGDGSGGSRVEFRVDDQSLHLIVPETGGFQAFEKQSLGIVHNLAVGRHRIEVRPTSKPGPAVMDLRQIRLNLFTDEKKRRTPVERMSAARLKATHEDAVKFRRSRKGVSPVAGLVDYRTIFHAHAEDSAHTAGTRPEMLAEAKKAGVSAIFLSDHYRPPRDFIAQSWRGMHDGVLFVPGSEIRGFLISPTRSIMPSMDAPLPAFVDAVRKDDGLIFLSHVEERPDHPMGNLDGMEIYNRHADAKKDKAGLLALVLKLTAPASLKELEQSLAEFPEELFAAQVEYPADYLAKWDRETPARRLSGIAANDCHHNQILMVKMVDESQVKVGTNVDTDAQMRSVSATQRPGIRVMTKGHMAGDLLARLDFDPYSRSFLNVSTHILAPELTEPALRAAVRAGRAYVAHDWICDPTGFRFELTTPGQADPILMGSELNYTAGQKLRAFFPAPCRIKIIKDGKVAVEHTGDSIEFEAKSAGVHRVEGWVELDGESRPWIYSNPIYLRL